MKYTSGDLRLLREEDRTALVNEALKALERGMNVDEYIVDIGWQSWMNDFTDAGEGEQATEEERKTIDAVIYEAWDEAEEIYGTDTDPYEFLYGKEILDRRSGYTVKVLGRHGDNGYIVEGRETEEDEWTRGVTTEDELIRLIKLNWGR